MSASRGGVLSTTVVDKQVELQRRTQTSAVPMSAVLSDDLPAGCPKVARRESQRARPRKSARQTERMDGDGTLRKRGHGRKAAAGVGAGTRAEARCVQALLRPCIIVGYA